MKNTLVLRSLVAAALFAAAAPARAAVDVVATTEDLASLVREVGGDRVRVEALARGYQDPHFVEAKPSFILRLNRADLLVLVGRELEVAWLPPLIQQSRNAKVQRGSPGYLDASLTARILEIPTGQITRAMGDVHPSGNPHYWLDPGNGRRMAAAIRDRLSQLSPGDAAYFAGRYADFDKRLAAAEARWDALMKPFRGLDVVTYHRSWPNFAERFGLEVIGYVEPRPGIPPSPSHTIQLIREMKSRNVKLLLVEPYFDLKTPASVARESGAKVVVLLPSVGGEKEVRDYIALFDHNLDKLVAAIKETGAR
ncbi:MAG TPA: metal ABC transporter substrate-binding protein [Gemmatimonadales bacterium]|nr:metal ABC transporter substrate-binding protein [Gemmatimonadales bacterium]